MTRIFLICALILSPAVVSAQTRPNHDLPQFKKLGQPAPTPTQPTTDTKK